MRFPAVVDQPVADSLRALPGVAAAAIGRPREMFARAEAHGIAGVIWDAWTAGSVRVDRDLAARLQARTVAADMDHEAHLAMLRRIDGVLTVPAVALKGPLFAARYYPRPSARGTTDIDLLVGEQDLREAAAALATVDYRVTESDAQVAWARRAHHHLQLARPGAPDVELHFHAYRGFGITLRAPALADRSVAVPDLRWIRVPSAEDELVYLAVHAAAHRFGRLAWLYDLRLVVERMSPEALEVAAGRARAWGVSRALSLAAELLVDVLGVAPDVVAPLGTLSRQRGALVHAVVKEPRTRLMRAVTRFAYATMLADSVDASLRYARTYSVERARSLLGLD